MVLFGVSAAERSRQTRSASERTLYRRTERFDEEGMESLFSSEAAKRIPVLRCCEEGKPLMRRGRKAQGPPY